MPEQSLPGENSFVVLARGNKLVIQVSHAPETYAARRAIEEHEPDPSLVGVEVIFELLEVFPQNDV